LWICTDDKPSVYAASSVKFIYWRKRSVTWWSKMKLFACSIYFSVSFLVCRINKHYAHPFRRMGYCNNAKVKFCPVSFKEF
jgi:hypothetical protein